MNKKIAAALSGGAVLVLALSACSSDDGEDKVNDWAKKYCDQAQSQIKKQAEAERLIRSTASDGDPADIQAADSKAFKDLAEVNTALAAAFRGAGAPPVDNGDKLVEAAAVELEANAKAYLDLKKQIDGLDTKVQQKFADGLEPVAEGLKKIEKNQAARNELREGDTGPAMAKQPGCKASTTSNPAAGSAPSDKPSDKPSEKSSEKPADKPAEKESDKESDKASAKAAPAAVNRPYAGL
ncbi:small secreted protein [Streptomyces sp. NPDC051907]|uniref:small secreted protein n=1 Tax=Streptomyces sp. NPDC051907 TaxID=3155284 RepID=UPI003415DA69